ncbi:MAG: sugar phosphate isomerase/epimerase family protein [Tepidisphaerales bacterium]
MLKLGFFSAILPDLSLEQVLAFAAEQRVAVVELAAWPHQKAERRYAGVTHVDVDKLADARKALSGSGVRCSALGYYPNLLSPDPAEATLAREHLPRVLHAAAELGIDLVNTFLGRDPRRSVEDNLKLVGDVWPPLLELAGKLRVRIGIENCPMWFTADEWPGGKNLMTTPALWRTVFTQLNAPHLGLNYDPSHFAWMRMDYLKPLRHFTDRLFHIHAKDVRVDLDLFDEHGPMAHPLTYHRPKLPGLGDIHWGRFFSVLTDVGYAGAVCVEVEDRAYEGSLDDRKAAIAQSLRYLRNVCPA